MDRIASSYRDIAAMVGIIAAAYTQFKWGKAHGKTEGVVEGECTWRQIIEPCAQPVTTPNMTTCQPVTNRLIRVARS